MNLTNHLPELHRGRSVGTRRARAFSLIEIMVVVTLLSVIVVGLMAMFSQTQRAFRLGMSQTDVLESGRIATGMLARELEQITPTYQNAMNFYTGIPAYNQQAVAGAPYPRTNYLGELFFISRENLTWSGIGYFLRTNGAYSSGLGPVCTLYRFETNNTKAQFEQSPVRLFNAYQLATLPSTNISRVLDGVVHFRVRAFDTNGIWINGAFTGGRIPTNTTVDYLQPFFNYSIGEVQACYYTNKAVPAYLEVELGILEQQTLARYRTIPDPTVQAEYLQKQAGHVHLFRQRIAIRNVDPSAYQ